MGRKRGRDLARSSAIRSEPIGPTAPDGAGVEPIAEAATSDPAPITYPKQIPAAVFAKLIGRSLRTLRNWDEAGLTHPEVRNSRRYYGADDLAAALTGKGRRGPRQGSMINYLLRDWETGS